MAEFRIDRLKFNWKGSWNNATAYKKDDVIWEVPKLDGIW